jgi:CBS domain containing-hemolysin-like protein
VGEAFAVEGARFEIGDMDGRRIDKLLAERKPLTEPAAEP